MLSLRVLPHLWASLRLDLKSLRTADPFQSDEAQFRRAFRQWALCIGFFLAVVFLSWPGIDIAAGELMQACRNAEGQAYWCAGNPKVELIRDGFIAMTVVSSLAILVALARTGGLARSRLKQAQIAFALAAFVAAPVIANVVFKDNWGRARPRDVIELGGQKQFTPPLVVSDQCQRNCSFVSGEASSAFAPLLVAAFLFPRLRFAFLAGGIAMGLLAGAVRMMQGGHFLSDVLFAGVVVALVIGFAHALVLGFWRHGLAPASASGINVQPGPVR